MEDGGLGMAPRWTWLAPVDLIGFRVVGGLDRCAGFCPASPSTADTAGRTGGERERLRWSAS